MRDALAETVVLVVGTGVADAAASVDAPQPILLPNSICERVSGKESSLLPTVRLRTPARQRLNVLPSLAHAKSRSCGLKLPKTQKTRTLFPAHKRVEGRARARTSSKVQRSNFNRSCAESRSRERDRGWLFCRGYHVCFLTVCKQ